MKTLEDFKSKFCEDCTGACQGMCYGYIPAEDQLRRYKETEYMKGKVIEIMPSANGFNAAIYGEDETFLNEECETLYDALDRILYFIRENSGIDSE